MSKFGIRVRLAYGPGAGKCGTAMVNQLPDDGLIYVLWDGQPISQTMFRGEVEVI